MSDFCEHREAKDEPESLEVEVLDADFDAAFKKAVESSLEQVSWCVLIELHRHVSG